MIHLDSVNFVKIWDDNGNQFKIGNFMKIVAFFV